MHAPPAGNQAEEEEEENKLNNCLEEMLYEDTRRYQQEYKLSLKEFKDSKVALNLCDWEFVELHEHIHSIV